MTETRPRAVEPGAATEDTTIRPSRVSVPEEDLAELRRRVAATMQLVADDVQGVVVPAGHWVAERAPEELLAVLAAFLAPYREGAPA
jgi:pimeloyl-ACP methyl ester carboxylesterase